MTECRLCLDTTERVDNDGYCVVCSPVEWFCDDCPDHERCEFKCRRDCPAKARPADEQRELAARIPLGDDLWQEVHQ